MASTTNLKVRNSELLDYIGGEKTYLTAAVAATGTTLTVRDNVPLANGEYIGIGEPGSPRSEIVLIGAAVTAGTSITVGACTFAHPIDTPIYRLPGNKLMFSRADTKTGTKSELNSGTTVDIAYNQLETNFEDTTNTTGFWWVMIYKTTTAVSGYIGPWNYVDDSINSFGESIELALQREGERRSRLLSDEFFEREVKSYRNHMKKKMNVDLEIGQDTSLSLVTDQWRYAMPDGIKSPNGDKGIIFLRLGSHGRLAPLTWEEYLDKQKSIKHTQVATAASTGDTSIVLDNTYEFDDPSSGTAALKIAGQDITYTTNTETTGTLSGIPASGTGSITADIAVDVDAWQDMSDGLPGNFCVWNNYIYLWLPASSTYNGETITIDYWADDNVVLTRTDALDVVSEACAVWLQWRIREAKKDQTYTDKRTEFFALRNEYFGTEYTNLGTRFYVDTDDQNTYEI